MKHARPININPFKIHLPITAWVSIGHRISGLVVFLLVPLLLMTLHISLSSEENFNFLSTFIETYHLQWFFWILFASLWFHFLAGMRHLLMDIHVGESITVSRFTGYGVWVVFVLGILGALGMWG